MGPVREQEVPQVQHLGQGRGAGAQGEDGREGVDAGAEIGGDEVGGEFRVDDGEQAVDEREAAVHAGHGGEGVGGQVRGEEVVREDVGFGFGAGGVEEGSGENVHALEVDGCGVGGRGLEEEGRGFGGRAGGGGGGGFGGGPGRVRVVERPGEGIEEPD